MRKNERIQRTPERVIGVVKFLGHCFCVISVRFPLVAVENGAKGCHVVDSADTPFCSGLFESLADQIFARTLDLAAVADIFQPVINIQNLVTLRKFQFKVQSVECFLFGF
jgi:hypothetical protein